MPEPDKGDELRSRLQGDLSRGRSRSRSNSLRHGSSSHRSSRSRSSHSSGDSRSRHDSRPPKREYERRGHRRRSQTRSRSPSYHDNRRHRYDERSHRPSYRDRDPDDFRDDFRRPSKRRDSSHSSRKESSKRKTRSPSYSSPPRRKARSPSFSPPPRRRSRSRSYTPPRRRYPRSSRSPRRTYPRSPRKSSPRRSSYRSPPPRRRSRSPSPVLDAAEKDRRTVFVQQIAARLKRIELIRFFEKAGAVRDASIIKDRNTNRSKGMAYVEFRNPATVPKAIMMTGEKLLGIPIIVQLTESEKNRLAMIANQGGDVTEALAGNPVPTSGGAIVPNRIYVGNLHLGMGEDDLKELFEPFGEIDLISLQKDHTGKSKGFAFLHYHRKSSADEAVAEMDGREVAGRPIRVSSEDANGSNTGNGEPSSSSKAPSQASKENYSGIDKGTNTSRHRGNNLDDTEAPGGYYNRVSRGNLMRKLMREEDNLGDSPKNNDAGHKVIEQPPKQTSRCVVLRNMFDPAE